MEALRTPLIDWAVAAHALPGEERSGDTHVVKAWGNKFLLAVIDGLGHGEHAANAAQIAADTLISHASDSEDVVSLMNQCHKSLVKTRGAVLSLALFDTVNDTITWLGVGNVDGLLLRADRHIKPSSESLLQRGGVVGYQMPSLRPSTTHIRRGDILILSTDGIRGGFEKEVNPEEAPQQIADMIIMNYNRKTDDALVMVARYTGGLS